MKEDLSIKAALHIYSKIIISAMQFLALIAVARFMGPTPLGMIGYAGGVVGIFSIVSNLGFSTTHRKKISEGKDLGECIGTYIFIRFALMTIWLSAFLFWIFYVQYMGDSSLFSKDQEFVLYIVAAYTVLNGHSGIMRHTFWANLEAAKSILPQLISRFIISVIKISVALLGLGVLMLASAQLIGYFFLILIYLYTFRKYPVKYPTKSSILDYIKFTTPLMLTVPFALLANSSDAVMIGYFWDVEEVAMYTVPMNISSAFAIISGTVGLVLLPLVSKKSSKKEYNLISRIIKESERYILVFMLPLMAMVIFFSEDIILLLVGDSFKSSILILKLLIIISTIDLLTRPYSTQLISTGFVKYTLIASVICALVHLMLNILLIPENILGYSLFGLGALGAGIATAISSLFRYLIYRYFAFTTIGTNFTFNFFIYPFSCVCMLIIMYNLEIMIGTGSIFFRLPIAIIGVLSYFVLLYFLNGIKSSDFILVKNIFNPSKFRKYITNEYNNNV